jgi:hypothetical protein
MSFSFYRDYGSVNGNHEEFLWTKRRTTFREMMEIPKYKTRTVFHLRFQGLFRGRGVYLDGPETLGLPSIINYLTDDPKGTLTRRSNSKSWP